MVYVRQASPERKSQGCGLACELQKSAYMKHEWWYVSSLKYVKCCLEMRLKNGCNFGYPIPRAVKSILSDCGYNSQTERTLLGKRGNLKRSGSNIDSIVVKPPFSDSNPKKGHAWIWSVPRCSASMKSHIPEFLCVRGGGGRLPQYIISDRGLGCGLFWNWTLCDKLFYIQARCISRLTPSRSVLDLQGYRWC